MHTLENKTVIVTGAAGALGREVVRVLMDTGAQVISLDLAFPTEMQSEDTHALDLTNEEAVKKIVAKLGPIHGLVNAAGGFDMGPTLYDPSNELWDKMFAINVTTAKTVMAAVIPKMLTEGKGAVVNVGAIGGLSGAANMSAYSASKSVVMNMTQSLSEEVKHQGINVNAVLPSIIDTPANRADMPDANFEEWVTPTQLATVIGFLLSDDSSGIHGALIPVKGLC